MLKNKKFCSSLWCNDSRLYHVCIYFTYYVSHAENVAKTTLKTLWIRKDQNQILEITDSRSNFNFIDALNRYYIMGTVASEYGTINNEKILRASCKLRELIYQFYMVLNGAGYHCSSFGKEPAFVANVELHYFPPYTTNFNSLEPLWKVRNELSINNCCFKSKQFFKKSINQFYYCYFIRDYRLFYLPNT
ncbi:transposase [Candidatus Enterovibrio altilux]